MKKESEEMGMGIIFCRTPTSSNATGSVFGVWCTVILGACKPVGYSCYRVSSQSDRLMCYC